MLPYPWKAYILFAFLASYLVDSSGAVNFTQCFAEVTSCAMSNNCALGLSNITAFSLLRTSNGSPVTSVDAATALSYPGCTAHCGTSPVLSTWTVFSEQYSTWLLPYLVLLSQLPFGSRRRMDNLMSVILTLGSPALAGYSLYMTLLNVRWANDNLFSGIEYPSTIVRRSVVQVFGGLQQVPLRIHPGESARFESLVVHPANDQWWTMLAGELNYIHSTWSIASATSITWVVIAYLVAVTNFITSLDGYVFEGQGTGSGLLWLLPIVIGWLVFSPKCDYDRVHDAYHKANKQVFVANPHDPMAAPTDVTSNFGFTISPEPDRNSLGRNITSPDELRIPPIFNYARVFSWSRNAYLASLFYRAAWQKSKRRIGVNNKRIRGNDVPPEYRLGSREQIIRYCRPDDFEYFRSHILWPRGLLFNIVVASLMSLQMQWGTTGAAVIIYWFEAPLGLGCRSLAYLAYGMLSTFAWLLLVSSSALGYYAHHLVDEFPVSDVEMAGERTRFDTSSVLADSIPTVNLTADGPGPSNGNNSTPVLLHPDGMTDKDVLPDTASEELGSMSTVKCINKGWIHARTLARLADWLRWMGKLVAIINVVFIIANSIFQFMGIHDNCYCDANAIVVPGSSAFMVFNPTERDIALARSGWIGGLALSLTSRLFFVGSIYLIRDPLPS